MQDVLKFLIFMIFAIPAGALILLLKRLREGERDDSAKERFLEALYAENLKKPTHQETEAPADTDNITDEKRTEDNSCGAASEKTQKKENSAGKYLTDEERIEMAKKLARETFADSRAANDIQKNSYESGLGVGIGEEKKLTREDAIRLVSNMLGRNDTKKSSADEIRKMQKKLLNDQKYSAAVQEAEKTKNKENPVEKKLTREEAIDMVSDMLSKAKSHK